MGDLYSFSCLLLLFHYLHEKLKAGWSVAAVSLIPGALPQMQEMATDVDASGTDSPAGEVRRAPGASAVTREWGKQSPPSKSLPPTASEQREDGCRDPAGAAPGGRGARVRTCSLLSCWSHGKLPNSGKCLNFMLHSAVEPFSGRTGIPRSHQELSSHLGCPRWYASKP